MSRTDKTNPYFVKWYYEALYLEENHDHRYHACNLPPKPLIREAREIKWNTDDCHWYPSPTFMRSTDARCSCYMCGYDAYESLPRYKRQRIEGRRYCRDGWMEEY
jgi:hypothetical protein